MCKLELAAAYPTSLTNFFQFKLALKSWKVGLHVQCMYSGKTREVSREKPWEHVRINNKLNPLMTPDPGFKWSTLPRETSYMLIQQK